MLNFTYDNINDRSLCIYNSYYVIVIVHLFSMQCKFVFEGKATAQKCLWHLAEMGGGGGGGDNTQREGKGKKSQDSERRSWGFNFSQYLSV